MRPVKLGFLAMAAAAAFAVLLRPFLLRRIRRRPHFDYSNAAQSAETYAELAAAPGWEAASLVVASGVALKGLLRRPVRSDAPWLLFLPGNDSKLLANAQKFLDAVRAEHDWGLAVYAYRGYDSSDGSASTESLGADGLKMFESLCEREQIAAGQLHVAAFSLGGYVAAKVAAHAAFSGKKLASVSLLASVANIEMVRSGLRARFLIGDVFETLPLLDAVPGPVLVLHGDADASVDISQGRSIAARLGSRATFRELPGVGHEAILESRAAIEAVREIIKATS